LGIEDNGEEREKKQLRWKKRSFESRAERVVLVKSVNGGRKVPDEQCSKLK